MGFSLSQDHRLLQESALDFVSRAVDLGPFLVPGVQDRDAHFDALPGVLNSSVKKWFAR